MNIDYMSENIEKFCMYLIMISSVIFITGKCLSFFVDKKKLIEKLLNEQENDNDYKFFCEKEANISDLLYNKFGSLRDISSISEDESLTNEQKFFVEYFQNLDCLENYKNLDRISYILCSQLAWIEYKTKYCNRCPKIEDYYVLGLIYEEGYNGVIKNKGKALEYYQKALTMKTCRSGKQKDYLKLINNINERIKKLIRV